MSALSFETLRADSVFGLVRAKAGLKLVMQQRNRLQHLRLMPSALNFRIMVRRHHSFKVVHTIYVLVVSPRVVNVPDLQHFRLFWTNPARCQTHSLTLTEITTWLVTCRKFVIALSNVSWRDICLHPWCSCLIL